MSGTRVLIADDDTDLTAEPLAELLRQDGYDVSVARDGRETLNRLHDQPPDVLLLDLVMPIEDGRSVASAIAGARARGEPWACRIHVIVWTAVAPEEVDGLPGTDAVLIKPVDVTQLEKVIEAVRAGTKPAV